MFHSRNGHFYTTLRKGQMTRAEVVNWFDHRSNDLILTWMSHCCALHVLLLQHLWHRHYLFDLFCPPELQGKVFKKSYFVENFIFIVPQSPLLVYAHNYWNLKFSTLKEKTITKFLSSNFRNVMLYSTFFYGSIHKLSYQI